MDRKYIYWQNYLNLENKFLQISKYIFITDDTNNDQTLVYSLNIANLLIETANEIESISFYLYDKLELSKINPSPNEFDNDCLKEIDNLCKICNKVVYISNPTFDIENKSFYPLNNIYKRNDNSYKPSKWNEAYNSLKHDKYNQLENGSIINLIYALGSLYLLNIYLMNPKIKFDFSKYRKIDKSFGSRIFSLSTPNLTRNDILFDPINMLISSEDSPFKIQHSDICVDYLNEFYKRMDEEIPNHLRNWYPKLHDSFLKVSEPKQRISNLYNFNKLIEASIENFNNEIPTTLNFQTRKELLLESQEWNKIPPKFKRMYDEKNINENNIQELINLVGENCAMEIWRKIYRKNRIKEIISNNYFEEFEISINNSIETKY